MGVCIQQNVRDKPTPPQKKNTPHSHALTMNTSTHRCVGREGLLVKAADVHVERREVRAAEARGGPGEAAVDDLVRQTHGLEHLGE